MMIADLRCCTCSGCAVLAATQREASGVCFAHHPRPGRRRCRRTLRAARCPTRARWAPVWGVPVGRKPQRTASILASSGFKLHPLGCPASARPQDVDLPTFARMCCAVLDLQPPAASTTSGRASTAASEQHCALLQSLHALFALYLEFRHNPAFQHLAAFEAAAAEQPGGTVAAAGAGDGA